MDSVSLTSLATEQLNQARQAHSGRASHTIHGGHALELRQTVVALASGHELAEHDSPGEATLQVLQGHVRLTAGDETWEGKPGDYVTFIPPSLAVVSPRLSRRAHRREERSFGVVMLSTAWSTAMGLRVPIVNAPMGGVAGGRLAAAVSAAGGLGMVGMGTAGSTSSLHAELPHVTGMFGIGLVDWVMRKEAGLFEAALAAQPVLISVSFGTDLSWVSRVHDAGIAAATQVYNSDEARRAQDAGMDVIVARGCEGGGHGDATIGTLPLLDAVLDAVSVPVLAAGGIASARSLAAVLAAGASGAWLGTCLSASVEALTTDAGRRALVAARETDTASTRVYDIVRHLPWAERFPSRVLRNDFVARWTGHEDALAEDADAEAELAAATTADDRRIAAVDAGQGVGMVTDVAPVAEVIDRLCSGAHDLLARWGQTART